MPSLICYEPGQPFDFYFVPYILVYKWLHITNGWLSMFLSNKKNSPVYALITAFFLCSAIQGAEKQYTPSLSARYPTTTDGLKSCLVGSCSYLLTKWLGFSPKVSVSTGIVSGLCTYVYSWVKSLFFPNFLDSILCNPKKVLWLCELDIKDFEKETENKFPQEIITIARRYEKRKNPIFLLTECTREGFGHCLLSREENPKFRNEFEKSVSTALVKKIASSKGKSVHYTSFACGGAFQDLVILSKTLAQKPNANLVIHMIDRKLRPFVIFHDTIGDNRKISPDFAIQVPENRRATLIENARTIGIDDIDDQAVENKLLTYVAHTHMRFGQMLAFLSHSFPNAKLELHIHDAYEHYLHYVRENGQKYADVITTADIQDDGAAQAIEDYFELCHTTLEHNAHSENFFLMKTSDKNSRRKANSFSCYNAAEIMTLHAQQKEQAKKIIQENKTFYATRKKIA